MSILKKILAKRTVKKSINRLEKSKIKRIKARSKRVGVEFRIPSKRIFEGKEYRIFDWKISLPAAKKIAKELREDDYKSRVAEQCSGDGRKGWGIYIRKE